MRKTKSVELLKRAGSLIFENWFALASLEAVYRLLELFILMPLFSKGFGLIMKVSGYSYLTIENLVRFLLNPLTILLLLLLVIFMAAAETWHIGMVICILDMSSQKKKVSLLTAAKYSFSRIGWIRSKGNLLLPLYVLLMLPLLNLGTGLVGSIKIPEFIEDTIYSNLILTLLLTSLYLIVLILVIRWLFAPYYLTIEGDNFLDGMKKSSALSKGRKIRNLVAPVIAALIVTVVFYALSFVLVIVIYLLSMTNLLASDIIMTVAGTVLTVLVVLFSMLQLPIDLAIVTELFYDNKAAKGEKIVHVDCVERGSLRLPQLRHRRIIGIVLSVFIIASGVVFIRGVHNGDFNLNVEHIRTMEISAHRGASAFYPENTMAAFRGAVEQNADWIELDVQQSKDGEIFVMHDTNFSRTTGVKKNCWELTWDEISKLDAGSFFSKEYAGEPIPLLKEVIDYAKETGIRLNIELKPTGHETDFEKKVVDLINDADFKDNCVVTSQVYSVLENIKKYDDSITTVYVMAVAIGEIEDLDYADDFSIEASFVTESLVTRMHNLGKQVYAWTIDTEENINKMISIGVDNIISNNVPLAQQCVEESKNSNVLIDLLDKLMS